MSIRAATHALSLFSLSMGYLAGVYAHAEPWAGFAGMLGTYAALEVLYRAICWWRRISRLSEENEP